MEHLKRAVMTNGLLEKGCCFQTARQHNMLLLTETAYCDDDGWKADRQYNGRTRE